MPCLLFLPTVVQFLHGDAAFPSQVRALARSLPESVVPCQIFLPILSLILPAKHAFSI